MRLFWYLPRLRNKKDKWADNYQPQPMNGNLIDRAKADIRRISSNKSGGFGRDLTFLAPTGETAAIVGLHTKIKLQYDTLGNEVNTKKVHMSFSESLLTDLAYPVRNVAGQVSLKGHKVTIADSTGTNCTYIINELYPDETIGLIVCILGECDS